MKIKNFVLGVAIMVLTIFVVVYGMNTLYSRPDWDDFCGDKSAVGSVDSEQECYAVGGAWSSNLEDREDVEAPVEFNPDKIQGWCDLHFECREKYEAAREKYARNLFLITLPLGIIIIVAGILVFGLETVGAGLAGGGVLTLLWGVIEYWQYGSNLMKFLLSLVGLVIVILLAYWFNRKK